MRVNYVEWPARLMPDSPAFEAIAQRVRQSAPDLLVTNEMPFGDWVWNVPHYDESVAARSIALHEAGLSALRSLGVPAVISSRPVRAGDKVANEAFALVDSRYVLLHYKHYFPEEPGWHEASWFRTLSPGFELGEVLGLKVGVLLCTEAMFNERARAYGRAGAELIVVPRATGQALGGWRTACAMAAVVSGCYVVSSNRSGSASSGSPIFGGTGMAFAPDGSPIGETDEDHTLMSFTLEQQRVVAQQALYPCYVSETVDVTRTGRAPLRW